MDSRTHLTSQDNTFRDLLANLLQDNSISAILIGENHYTSPTIPALISCLDILLASKREIILVTESLKQDSNAKLEHVRSGEFSLTTLNLSEVQNDLYFFTLIKIFLANQIKICGAENKTSNPFIYEKPSNFQEATRYAKDENRVHIPNQVFSELINSLISQNTLVIFYGGAAHPILTKQGEKIFDKGMKGKIMGPCTTIYLKYSPPIEAKTRFHYTNDDFKISGSYDYYIGTDSIALYLDAFKHAEDPVQLFKSFLNNLFTSYQEHPNNLTVAFSQSCSDLKQAFILFIKTQYKLDFTFKHLAKYEESMIKLKSGVKYKGLFSKPEKPFSLDCLNNEIDRDLKKIVKKTQGIVISTQKYTQKKY